ncbi:MAG: hypothetical protein WCF20_01695 [Methylovirgula sp.]
MDMPPAAPQQHEPAAPIRIAVVLRNRLLRPSAAQKTLSASAKPFRILAERPAGLIFLPLLAVALWALTHPYPGIVGDAGVYIGRALADLDPAGVGRDMMFVHDGQSRFSLFPFLLDHLVATLGTQRTGLLLGLLAMAAWIAALARFADGYVAKPFIAIVVIFVAVLPTGYGTPWRFNFSEVLAVPRPFAEALVLAALAGLAHGRIWRGLCCLVAATLIHPLMALAGWGVFALVLSREDRRWCAAFVGAALLLGIGAAAGLPLLHRLAIVMDPDLKAFALSRSPLLFPSAWPLGYSGPMLAEAASLAIAASLVSGRRRLVLLAAILVGTGGIAAQALFGDHFSLLLVIQAQLWRMAWLMAALGSAALAFSALALWRQGPHGHVVLALLAAAWLTSETPEGAALFACAAVAVHLLGRRLNLPVTWAGAWLFWSIASLLALVLNVHYVIGYAGFMARIPADAPHGISYFWTRRYIAFPILALVLLLAFTRRAPRLAGGLLGVTAIFLCAAGFRFWDDRRPFQKLIDTAAHPPALMQVIASRPGEILWVDGLTEAWYLAGRPQWGSPQQGVSTVFSSELARKWRARMQFLIGEGLADKSAIVTVDIPSASDLPRLTKDNVGRLCARPDAPAWIVAPINQDTIIPPGLAAHEWRLPQPNFRMTEEPHYYAWQRIDAYAILACPRGAPELR